MIDLELIECNSCGGAAWYEREIDPVGAWYGAWVLVSHECDEDCANHPDINPAALPAQLDEKEIRRSERAWERRLSD